MDRIVKIISEHVYTYIDIATGKIVNGQVITERSLLRKSLKDWEKELGDSFLRVSKQCIINMEYVNRIDKVILLKDGSEISIPKLNVKKCQDIFFDYCKRKMKWD